ncbi:hypothetical protein FOZ62_008739 [Perkinsus olseni]|uniref:Uncharacterized protein n=1 Tax=Perkinsus olseni TaxID=32597 RepID=A0A7J6QN24_PEROL|nr:hypothetical protein FOZ62_008739 [Perkinsus olseni]
MIPQDASVVDEGRNSGRLIEKSTRRGDPKGGDGLTTTPSRNVSEPHVEDTVDFTADEETDGDRQRLSPGVPDEEENDDDNGEPPETYMTPSSRATDEEERLATTTGNVPTTSRATTRSRRSSTSTRSFTTRLGELRESLGTSTRHTYGKFVNTAPMNGSLVVLVDADYTGLARVINHDDQGRAVLQPMDVIQEGVLTKTEDNETKDRLHVKIDNIIYVRPSNRSLTRARGKDLRELLAYVDNYMQ